MEAFVQERLWACGFKRIRQPQDGDIGIVEVLTGFDFEGLAVKRIPAIRFGKLWSVMSARGSATKNLTHSAVWRIA
jgi:hypothetical protein